MKNNKKTTAWHQFKKDFGHFPPKGLIGNQKFKKSNFVVINTSQFKELRMSFRISAFVLIKIIRGHFDNLNLNSSKLAVNQIDILNRKIHELKRSFMPLKKGVVSSNILEKAGAVLTAFLFLSLAPVFFILIVGLALVFLFGHSIKRFRETKSILGYYLKINGQSDKIYVNDKLINKLSENRDEVITHEHMHLIQYKASCENTTVQTIHSYVDNLDRKFIINNLRNTQRTAYMTNRLEVEVRLNELLICYYQAIGLFPHDYAAFMKMFLGCDPIYSLVKHRKEKLLKEFHVVKVQLSEQRGHRSLSEIFDLLIIIESDDFLESYVTQVLPVMYSHLLYYYGDEQACLRFFDTIPSKEMFYEIYGGNP